MVKDGFTPSGNCCSADETGWHSGHQAFSSWHMTVTQPYWHLPLMPRVSEPASWSSLGLIHSNNTFEKKGKSSFSLSGSASEGLPNVPAGNLIHNLLRKKWTCRPCPFNGKNTCYDITQSRVTSPSWEGRGGWMRFLFFSCSGTSQWVFLLPILNSKEISSVQFSHSVMSYSLHPHGLQHTWPPCPSPTSRACSNSGLSSRWCHPTISSSVVPFFSCLQSFPASGSFLMSQFFTSGGQSIGVSASASVLPMNNSGLISFKHQFFSPLLIYQLELSPLFWELLRTQREKRISVMVPNTNHALCSGWPEPALTSVGLGSPVLHAGHAHVPYW